jgi:hypothetical protein
VLALDPTSSPGRCLHRPVQLFCFFWCRHEVDCWSFAIPVFESMIIWVGSRASTTAISAADSRSLSLLLSSVVDLSTTIINLIFSTVHLSTLLHFFDKVSAFPQMHPDSLWRGQEANARSFTRQCKEDGACSSSCYISAVAKDVPVQRSLTTTPSSLDSTLRFIRVTGRLCSQFVNQIPKRSKSC